MGSRCSPIQANSVIEHHLDMLIASSTDEETIEACKLLKQFRYIDDILLALDDSKQAITITKAINKIFGEMGLKVTKFVSNSPELLETIPDQDRNPTTAIALQPNGISDQLGSISDTSNIVGLCWNPENDTLSFEQYKKSLEKEIPSSTCSISSIIPSIFDVNGEIEPYILRGKVILSETWAYETPIDSSEHPNGPSTKRSKLTWDEPLPTHLYNEFRDWIKDKS